MIALLFACDGKMDKGPWREDSANYGSSDDDDDDNDDDTAVDPIYGPTVWVIQEGQDGTLTLNVVDGLRLAVEGLPPGAVWDEASHTVRFRPDFTQGGDEWTLRFSGDGAEHTVDVVVADTIVPPDPTVVAFTSGTGFQLDDLSQHTDTFLAGHQAGRDYPAVVAVPSGAGPYPVRIVLHGFGGDPWREGWEGEFRIMPSDPDDTYWWGYQSDGEVEPYTQRRVLHLLDWVLETYPAADPERVYIEGGSMGGTGALTIGLLNARHFAWVNSTIGQTVPRNHRPSRISQLSTHWGAPDEGLTDGDGMLVWDRMDLTRVLLEEPALAVPLFTKHGKDDPIIHFGAVVHPSALTSHSFYAALQATHAGHLAVWDEGGHGDPDPVLPDGWWQSGWNPVFDDTSFVRRDMAYPAFTESSADGDPGDGTGTTVWSDESGYAADLATAGDTGWSGDLAGALSRGLRWDANGLVDTWERFELPLFALDAGTPSAPPYPPTGDTTGGTVPVDVDVTIRRAQAFRLLPGETVMWTYGSSSGSADADARGLVTVPLSIGTTVETLVLTR